MNLPNKYRTIGFIAAIAIIVLLLVSIAMVRNIMLAGEIEGMGLIYVLLGISISGIILLSVIVLRLSGSEIKNYYISDHYAQKNQSKNTEVEEEKEVETEQKKVTLEELERNIFPQKKFKYLDSYTEKLLINLGKFVQISQGVFYMFDASSGKYKLLAKYATTVKKENEEIEPGVGLTGQVALDKKLNVINEVKEDYLQIESGLGKGQPAQLAIVPVMKKDDVVAIMELASLKKFDEGFLSLLPELAAKLGGQLENFEMR